MGYTGNIDEQLWLRNHQMANLINFRQTIVGWPTLSWLSTPPHDQRCDLKWSIAPPATGSEPFWKMAVVGNLLNTACLLNIFLPGVVTFRVYSCQCVAVPMGTLKVPCLAATSCNYHGLGSRKWRCKNIMHTKNTFDLTIT